MFLVICFTQYADLAYKEIYLYISHIFLCLFESNWLTNMDALFFYIGVEVVVVVAAAAL